MLRHRWLLSAGLVFVVLMGLPTAAICQAQPEKPYFSRLNTFGGFGTYANDSSHILLGIARNRKLAGFGLEYSRRLWQGRVVNWQYHAEFLPIELESDPVVHEVTVVTSPAPGTSIQDFVPSGVCHAGTGSFSETINGVTFAYSYTDTCSRRWTIGQGFSPLGMQWNFLPRRRLQPVLDSHGGYLYSAKPIPVAQAGSFNFIFDVGAGLELYRADTRRARQSVKVEYRYHHLSNARTATLNPGIDNNMLQVTYSFGR